jgi:hypothetical protein
MGTEVQWIGEITSDVLQQSRRMMFGSQIIACFKMIFNVQSKRNDEHMSR